MMKQLLKQIATVFFTAVFILAASGIHLYQHYCNCTDELNGSFLFASFNCHGDNPSPTCSIQPMKKDQSCCQPTAIQAVADQPCEKNHNCCTTEYKLLKTDQFNYSSIQKLSFFFIAAYTIRFETNNTKQENFHARYNSFTEDIPPPDFGKDLLIALQQFKIADPLV